MHEAHKMMSALSRQDGSGLPFCCYCWKTLCMILNNFHNKKQVNSKLTQHGGWVMGRDGVLITTS